MSEKKPTVKAVAGKPSKGIPVSSKIPTSGRDSGTHSRSSSVSNLTTASDIVTEAGDATLASTHGFKLEDRVWVNGTKPGLVKFLGKTEFAPGVWAGVLLDEAVGKNDGSVAGVKYFNCKPNQGVFARPQKLTRTMGAIDTMGSTTNLKGVGATMGSTTSLSSLRSVGMGTPVSSRAPGTSVTSPTSATRGVCSKLRLGEKVVVSSTTGVKAGVLRFIGETDFAKGEWAGIELDEPVGKNDGSVAGKRYFMCPMKYGLFSPIHKISRAGGTSCSRTPSVRGATIRRSTSRESISSSVSNCSKSSRVKLGVTSLTNSQKSRTTGVGIMTTSRALEEALKEKEQHIEQLLKEHDLGRGEVARLTSRCEEIEAKYTELLTQPQQSDEVKRELEEQLATDKRKLEDMLFQLEEGAILKSDLEAQLQQKSSTFKRLEEFLAKSCDNKFKNIKEILEGKEVLTDIVDTEENDATKTYRQEIQELQDNLSKQKEEKDKAIRELKEMELKLKEVDKKTEEQLYSADISIQEKDDVINNLKNELNLQLEKLTNVFADNQALAEQMSSQAKAEKKQTEEVIKEFGEKVANLSEELKLRVSTIQELELSVQEKDAKIESLKIEMELQGQKIADSQDLNQSLELKSIELTEKKTQQQALESEVTALKLRTETEISEKEKKILDLVMQIEGLTSSLQEKEEMLSEKLSEVAKQKEKVKEMTESLTKMKTQHNQVLENAAFSDKNSSEKLVSLQDELSLLKEEKSLMKSKFDQEICDLTKKTECLTVSLQEKEERLTEKLSEIAKQEEKVKELTESLTEMKTLHDQDLESAALADKKSLEKLVALQEAIVLLKEEKLEMKNQFDQLKTSLEKQLSDHQSAIEVKNAEIKTNKEEIVTLIKSSKSKDEEVSQLVSKLELAEQKVEMLNKDSSEHVMTLQNELSKLKEDSDKIKTTLEQKMEEVQKENEKLKSNLMDETNLKSEKENIILKLENQVKCKEENITELTHEIEKHKKDLIALEEGNKEAEILYNKELTKVKEEFDSVVKKKKWILMKLCKKKKKLVQLLVKLKNLWFKKNPF